VHPRLDYETRLVNIAGCWALTACLCCSFQSSKVFCNRAAVAAVLDRVSGSIVLGECFGRRRSKSSFKSFAEVLDTRCCNVASPHNVSKLVIPPKLSFSTEVGVETLLQFAWITSLSSDFDAVGEVVYILLVILSITINNVRVSPFIWHIWEEEANL